MPPPARAIASQVAEEAVLPIPKVNIRIGADALASDTACRTAFSDPEWSEIYRVAINYSQNLQT